MSNFVGLCCILSTALAPLPSKKVLPLPTGATPTLGYVGKVDAAKGVFTIRSSVQVPEQRVVAEVIQKQGQAVTIQRTVTVYRTVFREMSRSLEGVKFVDETGKELPREETLKRMQGRVILMVHDPDKKGLDPTWASVLRADSIVLLQSK